MKTPICTFLQKYASENNLRLHMPGHKGIGEVEQFDLTEIDGADSLYEASGIIKESEDVASDLFGSHTLYSLEGSSLAIRAMLYLAMLTDKSRSRPVILAGRNAHKVFVSAMALLDFDVEWLLGGDSYLSCTLTPDDVEKKITSMTEPPLAVYVTSPDYLGNVADISGISAVCKRHGVLLLVDNAHGAYLAFTEPSMHPIALGADMCSDSAHKTLPAFTGAAYLHIADSMPDEIKDRAKTAMALFGSTSPSYLLLASLDRLNAYLGNGYKDKLSSFTAKLAEIRKNLVTVGYEVVEGEPMKLTVMPKSYGYTGYDLAKHLKKCKIVPEFYDSDHLVLMPTPEMTEMELAKLEVSLIMLKKKTPITALPPSLSLPKRVMSPKEAILSNAEKISVDEAEGRILADITVGCPPAVPIVISGEVITGEAIEAFRYYGIDTCSVVK
jgi:arginine/lysine/ornithine decarboxylase